MKDNIDILELAQLESEERRKRIFDINEYWAYKLFAEERQNIVDFFDINKNHCVLELNSEAGIITSKLAEKAKWVTSIEQDETYYRAAKLLNNTDGNITFENEDIRSFVLQCKEKYDFIFIINRLYEVINDDLLTNVCNLLSESGKLVIATDNKLGLKYWAGCQESLNGGFFTGLENYQLINTNKKLYSKKEIANILKRKGIGNYRFYYPYPDYKFPVSVFSDKRLPKHGELDNNIRDFEGERYLLFDEKKVFDTIIEEELFPIYSNSYLVVINR